MKKIKAVLAVSIALNLAAVAVLASPMAMPAKGPYTTCLSVGHATSLEAILTAALCPGFAAKFELSPGTCKAENLVELGLWRDATCPSEMKAQAVGVFPGDWTSQ